MVKQKLAHELVEYSVSRRGEEEQNEQRVEKAKDAHDPTDGLLELGKEHRGDGWGL